MHSLKENIYNLQEKERRKKPAVGYKEWKKSLGMLGYGKVNLSKEAKALIDSGRVEKLVSTLPRSQLNGGSATFEEAAVNLIENA